MYHAIGLVELSSIAKGIEASDLMLKSANVELLLAKTICPGKYIVLVGGEIGAVKQAVENGKHASGHLCVDSFVIANVHASVLPALSGVSEVNHKKAVGVVETYSVAACITAADSAVKSANVQLVRIHMAFGIGGKCYMVLNGEIADVKTAVTSASQDAGSQGLLVQNCVIPKPDKALWQSLL
ncbi:MULTISPECIES: BMC domain-containing protein [unclassified Agarivorans]|uniref:BMC domain-containing protein n=1 Tax=unclassified Agarivorans TaxID=2636026 RepID=UPI003D7C3CE1